MPRSDSVGNLRPFTKGDPRAVAAGRKAAANRAANNLARVESIDAAARSLAHAATTFTRGDTATNAWALANLIMARVASGDIAVKRGDEAAALLRAVFDVARLESGDPTSAAIVAHLSTADVVARLSQLAEVADRSASLPAATAVVHPPGGDVVEAVAVEGETPPS